MKESKDIITFLFTDIEGSTKLAQEFPDTLQTALERHHDILQNSIESYNGHVFEIVGDAFCCAFLNSEDAVKAALYVQMKLAAEKWNDVKIKVRIGIHTGAAEKKGSSYMGYVTLARTARVMSAAYGEQILISNDTFESLRNKSLNFKNIPEARSDNNEQVQIISFRDLGERRLKDVIQPIRLYQIIADGIRNDFPPLKTLDARPNNLPVQLTSFIGRETEIKRVKELLKQTHLLTLIGMGGSGKTRLSLQAGADLIDDFANGVWFAELAPLSDAAQIPQAIIKALRVHEQQGESPEDSLIEFLKDKEILLIIDNCEHLIDDCAALAEILLSNCPKLKLLTTSREALKCSGEQNYVIPSLKIPGKKEESNYDSLIQYEAVKLFIERALTVNPDFNVNNDNAPALAQICIQLDGIPLAIELAAARTKFLTPEKIHERLNDRFNLLTGGKRTALPKQKTLRAMIDWSYDLLSDEEKKLWKRLSVFAGGFFSEAVEEICPDEKLSRNDIIDLLGNLTEKSILIFDELNERYRMLETIKEYGRELLEADGESEAISIMHLNYFLKTAETYRKQLNGPAQKDFFDKIESDHDNFQNALSFSLTGNRTNEAARLAKALTLYWIVRGYIYLGNKMTDIILSKQEDLSKEMFISILDSAGNIKTNKGDYDSAYRIYEKCLALKSELGDKNEIAGSLNNLGAISARIGEYKKAKSLFEEYLTIQRELENKNNLLLGINNITLLELYTGNFEKAKIYIDEALALSEEVDEDFESYFTLRNAGKLEFLKENFDQSIFYHEKALCLSRKTGYFSGVSVTLSELSEIYIAKRNFEKAKELLKESLAQAEKIEDNICIAIALGGLGNLEFESENYFEAKKLLVKSLKLFEEIGDKTGMVNSLCDLGKTEFKLNNTDAAKNILKECLKLQNGMEMKTKMPEVLIILSEVFLSENGIKSAADFLSICNDLISSNNIILSDILQNKFDGVYLFLKNEIGEKKLKEIFNENKPDKIKNLLSFEQSGPPD